MKARLILLLLSLVIGILSISAQKSYEMELLNFVQEDERGFTFDVRMRNTNPSDPFGIELIQFQVGFNTALMNGGAFQNSQLTYVDGTSDLVGEMIIPISSYVTTNQQVIQWLTQNIVLDELTTYFDHGNWVRIGTFRARLRTALTGTSPHNFADVAHNLQLVPHGVIIRWCEVTYYDDDDHPPGWYRTGVESYLISSRTLTNSVDYTRQLAGYYMNTGDNWGYNQNWNNNLGSTHPARRKKPGATNNALIGVNANIADTTSVTVKNLYLQPNASLRIISKSTGTGSLIYGNNGVVASVERYIPAAGYHFVSLPITQATNPVSGLFMWSWLFTWSISTQSWIGLGHPTNTPLFVDRGYMIYKYPGPNKWQSDTTYTFTGPINNNAFTCYVGGTTNNHSLVPNPYPSAIDWNASAGWTKTNLYDAIWIWNPATGNYASYINGAGNNGGTRYIPGGQSFFVQASGANPGLSMNNAVRVHNSQPFFKYGSSSDNYLSIKSEANGYSDEAVFRFMEGASLAFDGDFDAQKMYGLPEAPQFYSYSSDAYKLCINTIPNDVIFSEILFGFELGEAKEVTLNFTGIESFADYMVLKFTDLFTGTVIDLRQTGSYTFNHSPTNQANRFKLTFNNTTGVQLPDRFMVDARIFDNLLHVSVENAAGSNLTMSMVNIKGQTLLEQNIVTGKTVIDVSGMKEGVYLLRISGDKGTVTRKLVK